jgi:hypothetical protein
VLLGRNTRTFQLSRYFPSAGANPNFLAVGDFNGDGKLDLVVANETSKDVSVLINDTR